MDIKALFLDVDGTLVSFETHRVPTSAIDALRQVHAAGVRIFIATGRAFTDLHELEAIPYDGVVALNGSDCVLRDGTRITCHPISPEDFHRVWALAQRYGFALAVENDKGIVVDRLDPTVVALAHLVNHPVPPVVDLEAAYHEMPCCQLCIYCGEAVEQEVMAQLPRLAVSRWNPHFADVNVAGVDKASGLGVFAAYYGFDQMQTLAFGDGGNDIPLLHAAGKSVAMGGASERVKAAADYVTGTVDAHGIRDALLHFGLL